MGSVLPPQLGKVDTVVVGVFVVGAFVVGAFVVGVFVVGAFVVGTLVGVVLGRLDGCAVGNTLGDKIGAPVGNTLGDKLGEAMGGCVGLEGFTQLSQRTRQIDSRPAVVPQSSDRNMSQNTGSSTPLHSLDVGIRVG